VYCAVRDLLCVQSAAEKLMGESVIGLFCKDLVQIGGGFVDAALQEKCVGLGSVGQCEPPAAKEEERNSNANLNRRLGKEHD
jgi:hypothetical protein